MDKVPQELPSSCSDLQEEIVWAVDEAQLELKLRIIVFPTYQPKIIIPTNYTDNYPAKQKFKLPSPYALYRNTLNDEHHFKFPITKFQTSPSN